MIKKYLPVFADFLAVLAFGLSLFIACRLFPNNDNTGFDYQAILVAILGGLFTLIVGWNIYQAIDFNNKVSDLESLRNDLTTQLQKFQDKVEINQAKILGMLSQSATAVFFPNERKILKFKMIGHGINAIKLFSKHPEDEESKEAIDKVITTMISGLNRSKDVILEKDQVQMLILKCGKIEGQDKIKDFNELITLIQSIPAQ